MYKKFLISGWIFIFCLIFISMPVQAQDPTGETGFQYDLAGKWRLAAYLNLGFGLDDHEVGQTSDNKAVTISGGGGYGGMLSAAYGFDQNFELGIEMGIQDSPLTPDVENAEGSFMRTMALATLRYRIPVANTSLLMFGLGTGYYAPDDMDIDMSKATGGGHNIFSYDSSIGFHLSVEYAGFFSENFSWSAGLKYYTVKYSLTSANSDGISVPVGSLPPEIRNELGELDGSGIDVIVSINMHL